MMWDRGVTCDKQYMRDKHTVLGGGRTYSRKVGTKG